MPKLILTIDIPDDKFNLEHYPGCETAVDCIKFDLKQVEDDEISETELIDNYLDSGGEIYSFEVG